MTTVEGGGQKPELGLELVKLRTPADFRDYFVNKLGMFLGKEVGLSLPSQEHCR